MKATLAPDAVLCIRYAGRLFPVAFHSSPVPHNIFPLPFFVYSREFLARAGYQGTPAVFEHLWARDSGETTMLLLKANDMIEALNFLAEGETIERKFFSSREYAFIHVGQLSNSVEASLERILMTADISIRRVRAPSRAADFYPWDGFPDDFPPALPGSSGEPVEVRGFAKLIPEKMALPIEGAAGQVDFLDVLPAELKALYHPSSRAALRNPPPRWQELEKIPVTKGYHERDYPEIIRKLVECGILRLRRQKPRVVNGLAGVKKDHDKIRLIADCRRANLWFIDPPSVQLPSPSDIVDLVITPASSDDLHVCVAKSDINAFYHRLRLPDWMCEFFGFPKLEIDGETWWPVGATLPMGFSHAVVIAHTTNISICRPVVASANVAVIGIDNFLDTRVQRSAAGFYLDDNFQISTQSKLEKVNRFQLRMVAALEEEGLQSAPKKLVLAEHYTPETDVLGIAILRSGEVFPKASRLSALIHDSQTLMARRRASGKALSSIASRWVWTCLINRASLSILQHVYLELDQEADSTSTVSDEVASEVNTLCRLSPLFSANLFACFADVVLATDASLSGGGVCVAEVTQAQARDFYSRRVRRGWWSSAASEEHVEESNPLNFQMDPAVVDLIGKLEWRTVVSYRFRFEETRIVLLEARALLTGLRWLASDPRHFGRRVIIFLDSQSLLGAVVKGRSSSTRLNRLCRRLAAIFLATQIKPSFLWVASSLNPADAPSRGVGREP